MKKIISFFLFVPFTIHAQIVITQRGTTYSQDFNSLAVTGGSVTWTDNSTIAGWYASQSNYSAGSGSSNSSGMYSYGGGATNPSSDRALGSLTASATGSLYYGIRLQNSTCNDLTSFIITYTGEQWRNAANASAHKLDFQYRVGSGVLTSGVWVDADVLDFTGPQVSGSPNELDGNAGANRVTVSGVLGSVTVLPGNELWFRWVDADEPGTDHGLAIDDFSVTPNGAACYYRTIGSGDWNSAGMWEESDDNSTWVNAASFPDKLNAAILVRNTHTLSITSSVALDQVTVESGGVLIYADQAGSVLSVNDGTGVDMLINGAFHDLGPANISWTGSATWQLGAYGALLRTRSTSSNLWRDAYHNGISNIPSTSNWIVRKTGSDIPSLTGTSMTYPNLTIENISGSSWITGVGCSFTGASDHPVIKGNLDVGGTGTSPVDLLNENTNTDPVLVQGDMIIRSTGIVRNYGTGFELKGNLTVNGAISYSGGAGTRGILFSGSGAQSVGGSGSINMYKMEINKSAGTLALNSPITVDHSLLLTSGIINSTAISPLTIGMNGSVGGASDASHVNGPARYIGLSGFIFPVGDGTNYRPLEISSSASGTVDFTCEYYKTNPQAIYNNILVSSLHHISACEYWTLERNAGSASKNVTLSWDNTSCGVSAPADLRVARWDGTQWKDEGNTGFTGNTFSGTLTSTLVSSFSPFTLASVSPSNLLPVEWLDFTASEEGNKVVLRWKTASEFNTDHFTAERSNDCVLFLPIGQVEAAGTSSTPRKYMLEDTDPLPGLSYYRIRQTDKNGGSAVSKIVTVSRVEDGFYMNAFQVEGERIRVLIYTEQDGIVSLELVDRTGRVIVAVNVDCIIGRNEYYMPAETIADGIYILQAESGRYRRIQKIILR